MISRTRALILTARPKTLATAIVPVMVASALVKAEGLSITAWISWCALLSAVFIQIGTNFANDALDFIKGADKETRLGEARASQSGWFSARTVMRFAVGFFLLAFLLGIPLVMHGGWPIVVIGLVSLVMGYAYTGGPFPLAYIGLGDLFVILFFGLVAVGGVYYLQTGSYSISAFVAGLQIGLLATVLIAINNLRDLEQDRLVGKRTFAVRLGPRLGRIEVLFLVLFTYLLNFFWLTIGWWPAFLLPILVLPLATQVVGAVISTEAGRHYNQLLARAAFMHILFGLSLSAGFFWQ